MYRIRTGRWSDGSPFDARDVAFTIEALRNPRTAVPDTSAVAPIASYTVPRSAHARRPAQRPSAPFVTSFLSAGANDPFSILPRHIAARYASLDQSSLDTDPVGLGPFRLVRWKRGERLEFERNPYYWRGRCAQRRASTVASCRTRRRGWCLREPATLDVIEVAGLDIDAARTVPQLRAATPRRPTSSTICNSICARPPLRDADRAPGDGAGDRPAALGGETCYRGSLIPTDSVQSDPRYRATRALAAVRSRRGARRSLRGKPLAFDFAIASHWRNSARVAVALAADLAAAGITANIRGVYRSRFSGGQKTRAAFSRARATILRSRRGRRRSIPDRSYLFGCAASPRAAATRCFSATAATIATRRCGARTYEPRTRAPYYRDAGNRLVDELPVVPLGFERRIYAVNKRLRGFRPNVLGREYWNAWELSAL